MYYFIFDCKMGYTRQTSESMYVFFYAFRSVGDFFWIFLEVGW